MPRFRIVCYREDFEAGARWKSPDTGAVWVVVCAASTWAGAHLGVVMRLESGTDQRNRWWTLNQIERAGLEPQR